MPFQSYSCDAVDKVPPGERCRFITEECESEGGLPYTQWYYCHVAPRGAVASFFFTVRLSVIGAGVHVRPYNGETRGCQLWSAEPALQGLSQLASALPDMKLALSAIRDGTRLHGYCLISPCKPTAAPTPRAIRFPHTANRQPPFSRC
jgi:hypothetical protein